MTAMAAARLTAELLLPASNAVVAILLLRETGWRSLVPALLMFMLVARLERVPSPQPYLLAAAVAACVVVSVARGSRLRPLRLAAVIICALGTAAIQVQARL